jgi:hypothetical protein
MFWPAFTGFGLPASVTLRSASVATVTPITTVAELLPVFVSRVVVATLAVSVIRVPGGVPVFTVTITGNVLVEPGATVGFEQLMVPVVVQVHPAGTGVSETKVVLFGIASVKVAPAQLLGPLLVTTCVYVILLAAVTGLGVPLFVTARSQAAETVVTTVAFTVVALLAETDEVAVMLATVTEGARLTAMMMSAVAFAARLLESVHVIDVVTVHVQPAGAETET